MNVITRFAPSPTGFLHIGGCRTALFNYLFARHHNGKFLLRIEDTDKARSTKEAILAIKEGMEWLNLDYNDEIFYQSERATRHKQVAEELVAKGMAYYCYASAEEMDDLYKKDNDKGSDQKIISPWRNRDHSQAPQDIQPAIRLKTPIDGQVVINDLVQGEVIVQNKTIDDMVILRSDGTPTYMLAVVVDDHDMGITHIIRGDDHLTNAFRQYHIYQACGWKAPQFAHIPLIHGQDGKKLSKRHGALGVDAYNNMGILPEAMNNYLLRLGWSHGDDEIITRQQAIDWFDTNHIGKSPSCLDFNKLEFINSHYIKVSENKRLVQLLIPFILQKFHKDQLSDDEINRLEQGIESLKQRAKTLIELAEMAKIYLDFDGNLEINEKVVSVIKDGSDIIDIFVDILYNIDWQKDKIDQAVKLEIEKSGKGFAFIGKPLRAAISFELSGPPLPEIIFILGRQEVQKRLKWIKEKISG